MHKDKASRDDLEFLRLSVDESRAKSIFNDMKELFDETVKELKKQSENEKEKTKEAFQFVQSQNQEKAEKNDMNYYCMRVEKVERQINIMHEE